MQDRKDSPLEIKEVSSQGIVEGYASLWGDPPDSYGDIVVRGAFTESLKERQPKFLWQHQTDKVIGDLLEAREDDRGLFTRWQLDLEDPDGQKAFHKMRKRHVTGLSIGFVTVDADYGEDGRRFLKKAELWEVSSVTFPAASRAHVTSVRTNLPLHQLLLNAQHHLEAATREAKALAERRQADARDLTDQQREAADRLDAVAKAWIEMRAGLVVGRDAKANDLDLMALELDMARRKYAGLSLGASK